MERLWYPMEGFMCMRVQQDMSMYKSNNSSSYILSGTVPKVRNSYEILATHFHLLIYLRIYLMLHSQLLQWKSWRILPLLLRPRQQQAVALLQVLPLWRAQPTQALPSPQQCLLGMTKKLARLANKMKNVNLEAALSLYVNVAMRMTVCLVTSATRMDVHQIPSYAFQDISTSECIAITRFNAHHIAALSLYVNVAVTLIAHLKTNDAIGRALHFPVFQRKFLLQTQLPVSSRVLDRLHRCVHLHQWSPQINPQWDLPSLHRLCPVFVLHLIPA